MYVTNIGYNHSHNADFDINRPNGSGDYLLLLLKTSAIFTFNGVDVLTEPDSYILFSVNTPQCYRADGTYFSNDWFHFILEEEDIEMFRQFNIPQNQVIHIGDTNELSILINNMCYETYASNEYKSEAIALYLKLFFIKLYNKTHITYHESSSNHYNKIANIRTKLYNQPYYAWNIVSMANELTMSKSSFQHLYKKFFGVSPITDLILSRVEHAKYLLSTTDISVKKVAEMCGYNNEIHFMRQFKEQTRFTPTEYRESKRS